MKYVFNVLILILGAVFFSVMYVLNLDLRPTVLSQRHSLRALKEKDNKIIGSFIAQHDNLSMINIVFNRTYPTNSFSRFTLRELSTGKILHSSQIGLDQYSMYPDYIFGFPIITNSKNKKYIFEIYAIEKNNLPKLDNSQNNFFSKYTFSVKSLLKGKEGLRYFLTNKVLFYIFNFDLIKIFLFFCLPLFFYIFSTLYSLVYSSKLINKIKKYIYPLNKPYFVIILCGICFDIFIFRSTSIKLAILLLFFYGFGIFKFKVPFEKTFLLCFLILTINVFAITMNVTYIIEKMFLWIYILLFFGILQVIMENPTSSNN